MKVIVAGVLAGDDAASLQVHEPPASSLLGVELRRLWSSDELPPAIRVVAAESDVQVVAHGPTRGAAWSFATVGPFIELPTHRADTVALVSIASGQMTLRLDTGSATLGVGDAAVVLGVAHRWTSGPHGCEFFVVTLGAASLAGPSVTQSD